MRQPFRPERPRDLTTALVLASCLLVGRSAAAQGTDTFRGAEPFPGTVRDQLRDDLAKSSNKVYGAIGALERHVMPTLQKKDGLVAVAEFGMLVSALKIPGRAKYGTLGDTSYRGEYQLLPADVYSYSVAFGYHSGNWSFFGSSAVVYPRVTDGTEASVGRIGFPLAGAIAVPISHLLIPAAIVATGPTQIVGDEKTANLFSYVLGGGYTVKGISGYLGLVGSAGGAGVYTNLTQNRLHALVSAALADKLEHLDYFKAGIDRLPRIADTLGGGGGGSDAPAADGDGTKGLRKGDQLTSFYGRRVNFLIPRRNAQAVSLDPGRVAFWSGHAEQANVFGLVDLSAAVGVSPGVFLHEARIGLHTPNFYESGTGVGASVGAVQLPALYMLAQQPGYRVAVRGEVRVGHAFRLAVFRNEPEILAPFPYAYDAWAVQALVCPLALSEGAEAGTL